VTRLHADIALVERLIAAQFPHWSGLPVRPVDHGGWDNLTFHLGTEMTVRMPSAAGYVAQVAKEHRWLPILAPQLPLPIPVPLAQGAPGEGYPFPWSVYRWLDGEPAFRDRIASLTDFALDLAAFLAALQKIDATGGPAAGAHNFFRGGPLSTYDSDTRSAIAALGHRIPGDLATEIWEVALAAHWSGPPVWLHGDVAYGNLLVRHGSLAAVIDLGGLGVGDPSCDLAIAWTLLSGTSRSAFRAALDVDASMWARGRGWALWKALIMHDDPDPTKAEAARSALAEVFAEYRS
jgi:aminoglycoside phosphotransferase (APT) family kinase protein